jgi:hypothetical protein
MQAVLTATEDRKATALQVLRGAAEPERSTVRGKLPESYVGLKDVAAFLGVSGRSVLRWRIPGHKFGSRTKFRLTEVTAYLGSQEFSRRTEELKEERGRER